MNKVYILPTGYEIKNGTVLDLDSAEILMQIIKQFPTAQVTRLSPVEDIQNSIIEKINEIASKSPDLIVLIGGSGGGHRYTDSLSEDYTHSALTDILDEFYAREIYGKNGHMWSKLVCGKINNTTVINVPGPFTEAQVAIKAFVLAVTENKSLDDANYEMAQAVFNNYPTGAVSIIK